MDVLLVDDDEAICELTAAFLSRGDDRFDCTVSKGGRAARELLRERSFDAVVSDYDMPELDGLELLSWLRARGDETPFIVFTGRGRESVAIEAVNRGANRYLRKGGDPTTQFGLLATAIRQEVEQSRVARAVSQLARALSGERGNAFFDATVAELASVLDVDYVLVGRLVDDQQAVEIVAAQTPVPTESLVGFTYGLDGTPCADAVHRSYCRVTSGVQQAYPDDTLLAEWHIESYMGCPLFDMAGQVIGLLEALHTSPIDSDRFVEEVFDISASRIAAELELLS